MRHRTNLALPRIGRALSLSVSSQAFSSATNFAFGLYLVRALDPAEFGLYGLGFALALFYSGIGGALLLSQMVVHTPDKRPEDRVPYAARMFVLVVIFCAITVLLGLGILSISAAVWLREGSLPYVSFGAAVLLASVASLIKEFLVRHAYNIRAEWMALAINIVLAVGTLGSIAVLEHVDFTSSAEALFAFAGAHSVAIVAGLIAAQLPLHRVAPKGLYGDMAEAWTHGKWAIAQSIVFWLRTQAHTYVSIALAGPAALGVINATRLLISPVLFLVPAISQLLLPRLAALRNERDLALRTATTTALVALGLSLLYSVVLLASLEAVSDVTLGSAYANHSAVFPLTAIWCMVMCVHVTLSSYGCLVQALKRFRQWAVMSGIAGVVAIVTAIAFTLTFGIAGSVLGLLLADVVLLGLVLRNTHRH